MDIIERIIQYYEEPDGTEPYTEWFDSLKNEGDKGIIRTRLGRVRLGNFGDCKPVGEEVFELRIHAGPGYRIYFGQFGRTVVMLLTGGEKGAQDRDILKAKAYWLEFRRHQL